MPIASPEKKSFCDFMAPFHRNLLGMGMVIDDEHHLICFLVATCLTQLNSSRKL
jgi:hypothetical protein